VTSPIIIDLDGDGLPLTSADAGVFFDLNADGVAEQLSWTRRSARDGFLVLDRNGNGVIDDGRELFGSATDQPPSTDRNGFRALAEYDLAYEGGNGDGHISERDEVFRALRVWFDLNHDGISQPSELVRLRSVGITAISLDYRVSGRRDSVGNLFRYVGRVLVDDDPNDAFRGVPRAAIDVYLVHTTNQHVSVNAGSSVACLVPSSPKR
jgi:hypothetical protein